MHRARRIIRIPDGNELPSMPPETPVKIAPPSLFKYPHKKLLIKGFGRLSTGPVPFSGIACSLWWMH
jgi:hypothetical protein